MGRIVAQLKLSNYSDPNKALSLSALVGYICLEQAGAAVDMLGQRLVHVKRVDLK